MKSYFRSYLGSTVTLRCIAGSPEQLRASESRSKVWLFVTPWTIQSWNSPGQNTGVSSLSLLQGIFAIQGSNPDLRHCRQILYQLSHRGRLTHSESIMSDSLPYRFSLGPMLTPSSLLPFMFSLSLFFFLAASDFSCGTWDLQCGTWSSP